MNALACRPDSRVVHQECQDCDRARPGPVTARAGSDSGSRPADASHPSGMGDGGRGDARIDRPAEGEDPTARIRRRGSDRASLPSQLGQHWVSFDSRKRPINPPQGVGNRGARVGEGLSATADVVLVVAPGVGDARDARIVAAAPIARRRSRRSTPGRCRRTRSRPRTRSPTGNAPTSNPLCGYGPAKRDNYL
jgi:hypothetical protein